MLKRDKLSEISKKLTADQDDFISAFRKNLFIYINDKDITVRDISEAADIPFSTLNTFLYGSSKDLKLSTAIKLARALNVSIDELTGADTMQLLTRESIAMCRCLPDSAVHTIRWHIRYIDSLCREHEGCQKYILIMQTETAEIAGMKIISKYQKFDISNFKEPLKSILFSGISISNDEYMPYYSPYDILLIANDRNPRPNEHVVIRLENYLFIVKQREENGITKYYSIRDGKYRLDKREIDEFIGYIALKTEQKQ